MHKELLAKFKTIDPKKRYVVIVTAIAVIVVCIVLLMIYVFAPKRSVEAYCKEYTAQSAKLPHSGQDKYEAGIFKSSSDDPRNFADAYAALERVAPEDIRHNVAALQSVFQTMVDKPAQSFSAGLSGLGPEYEVEQWTNKNCGSQ